MDFQRVETTTTTTTTAAAAAAARVGELDAIGYGASRHVDRNAPGPTTLHRASPHFLAVKLQLGLNTTLGDLLHRRA
jgi:hypothetical protein